MDNPKIKPESELFHYKKKIKNINEIDYIGSTTKTDKTSSNLNRKFVFEDESLCYVPSKTKLFLTLQLRYSDEDGNNEVDINNNNLGVFINNAPLYLFNSMSYSIKNKTIETVQNVGRTSLLEILSTYSKEYKDQIEEGFLLDTNHLNDNPKQFYKNKSNIKKLKMLNSNPESRGIFQVSISLNKVFSFFRDTNNVIKGFKHEFLFTLTVC